MDILILTALCSFTIGAMAGFGLYAVTWAKVDWTKKH